MNGNLKGSSGTAGLEQVAAQAVILDAALLREASVPHSWGLCSAQRHFVRHRKTMVTCDSISSYSLQKPGSSSASTVHLGAQEGVLGALPWPHTEFRHGFWLCLEWEALTPGAFGGGLKQRWDFRCLSGKHCWIH